jgi:Nitrous oxide-stimulated promoter
MKTRIEREKRLVKFMINRYCADNHKTEQLCFDCNDLLEYSLKHLIKCPFAVNKPACSNCTIHCYSKIYKKKIQTVMRYSGPKMIYKCPKDSILYFFDKLRYRSNSVQDI